MRRSASILVGVMLAAIAASPTAAADTYHVTGSESSADAYFSNIDWETFDWDNPAPGTYFSTEIYAGESLYSDAEAYAPGACVYYDEFTIDGDGLFAGESSFGACADAATYSFDRRLSSASVEASIPVVDCAEWDEETGDCIGGLVELGTIEVDLTWTGTGQVHRSHGTDTWGNAGEFQFTSHGTSASRTATPGGTATLEGSSLIDGATFADGRLWSSRDGWVDVSVSGSFVE